MCALYGLGSNGETVELNRAFGMSDTGNVTSKWTSPVPGVTIPQHPAALSPKPFGLDASGQAVQQKPWFDINGGVRWVPMGFTHDDYLKEQGITPQPRTGAPPNTPGVDRPPVTTATSVAPPQQSAPAPAQTVAPLQQSAQAPALGTVAAAQVRRPEARASRSGAYAPGLGGSGRLVS